MNTMRVDASDVGHLEQLQTRQNFLVFLVRNSSLTLSKEQVDQIWDNLVTRSARAVLLSQSSSD